MDKKFEKIEIELDQNKIDEILEKGVQCCAEAEIGEVIDCLLVMFQHIQNTDLVQGFKRQLGPEHDRSVDKFLIMLLISEVATITGNFGEREEKGAEA